MNNSPESRNTVDTPSIAIHWDPETQQIQVKPDKDAIKNWEFVVALLRMAIDVSEAKKKELMMAHMQRAMQAQAQGNQIARKVLQGH